MKAYKDEQDKKRKNMQDDIKNQKKLIEDKEKKI